MILLTRFHSGERFAVNPDLIERVEETPDTVITLTNGAKHVVQESLGEIAESVQMYKARTLALATRMSEDPSAGGTTHLHIVHSDVDVGSDRPPDDVDPSGPETSTPGRDDA